MARTKQQIEVPGGASEDSAGATDPAQSQETTPAITTQPDESVAARNEALSNLPASALEIITRFEALGFTDMADQPLTSNLQFIDLVKQATTQPTQPVITEDGQRKSYTAPVLTEDGWHVPG